MAITLQGTNPTTLAFNGTTGCSGTVTSVQAGEGIILMVRWGNMTSTISSATCSGETVDIHEAAPLTGFDTSFQFCSIKNVQSSGNKTISISVTGAPGYVEAHAFRVSGHDSATFYDSGSAVTSTGTGTSATMNVSVDKANAMIIGVHVWLNGEGTAGTGYTDFDAADIGWYTRGQYDLDAGAAGAIPFSATNAAGGQWRLFAGAFQAFGGTSGVTGTFHPSEPADAAHIRASAGGRFQVVTLVDESGAPLANLTGLKCYGWDTNVPSDIATTLPVDFTASGTTDANGVLNFERLNTTMAAGNVAFVLVTDSTGSTGQSPVCRSFFGPVQITAV